MADKKRRKRKLSIRWLSPNRYRGSSLDWLEQGPSPRPKTAEWLEEGPRPRASIAEWLESKDGPTGGAGQTDSANQAAASGQKAGAEQRPETAIAWTVWCGVGAGITLGLLAAQKNVPAEALKLGLVAGVATWCVLEFALWFYRNLAYILFGGVTCSIGLGAAVGANPHCLKPVTPGAEDEQALCLAISVFAPELAPMSEIKLGLVPVESTGQRTLELHDPPSPARELLEHLPWQLLGRAAWAAPDLADDDAAASLESFDGLERKRFNHCVTALYEAPALNFKSWAMAKYDISREDAHDAVMDALVGVCQNYMTTQIRELEPYYRRAVTNQVMNLKRHGQRQPTCAEVYEEPAVCLTDRYELTKGEQVWLQRALCELKPAEREMLEQWKDGGSWKEVGQRLGLSPGDAANLFNNTIRKVSNRIDRMRCASLPARGYLP